MANPSLIIIIVVSVAVDAPKQAQFPVHQHCSIRAHQAAGQKV